MNLKSFCTSKETISKVKRQPSQGQRLPSYSLRLELIEDVILSPDCAERSESLNSSEGAAWPPKSPSLTCSGLGAQERVLKGKIDSQWEFALWFRKLKQGLCINLEEIGRAHV